MRYSFGTMLVTRSGSRAPPRLRVRAKGPTASQEKVRVSPSSVRRPACPGRSCTRPSARRSPVPSSAHLRPRIASRARCRGCRICCSFFDPHSLESTDNSPVYPPPVDIGHAVPAVPAPLGDQRVEVLDHREFRGDTIRPEHGRPAHLAVAHEPVVRVGEVAPLVGLVATLVEVEAPLVVVCEFEHSATPSEWL